MFQILVIATILLSLVPAWAQHQPADLLEVMQTQIQRSMETLGHASAAPLYNLQYQVTEERTYEAAASNGGLDAPKSSLRRYLDVDVRVGSMNLDNTHEIRGGNWQDNYTPRRVVDFPIENDSKAMSAVLWAETEYQFQKAQERFTKVLSNQQVKVEAEDTSADFSTADPYSYSEKCAVTQVDTARWHGIVQKAARYLAGFPFVYDSEVRFAANDKNDYITKSDGSALQQGNHYLRLTMSVSGMADDGMELQRYETFSAATMEHMPDEATVMKSAERIVNELQALIHAPLVEPYIGPAILLHRASGVFFHEIFGHRIEGHRQKSSEEGQTFTKKLNQQILPSFISVYDDPTQATFKSTDLRGYYRFDDEGTQAQRVTVVDKGVLRNFLTSRSPIANFSISNAHARRLFGFDIVSRQGNLIVESSKKVPYDQLRRMLIAEVKKQGKEYGLIFDDIAGGFTMTGRYMPQAFKVVPLLVYRVYPDGRPDQVVRGVDIVGTPLTSFSKIIAAADDDAVFNGTCGAESGWVPVSAVSPSLLVSEIEVEKKAKEQEKPPILPPPNQERNAP